METMSVTLMLKALDALAMRSVATAQNIANAGSPEYRPLKVSFEDALRGAAAKGEGAVAQMRPTIEVARDGLGTAEMRLDLELATASGTAARYGALVELLNRQLQMHALATSGGR